MGYPTGSRAWGLRLAIVFLASVSAGTATCQWGDPTEPTVVIHIEAPSASRLFTTSDSAVVVGGDVSGASSVGWRNDATGESGDAIVEATMASASWSSGPAGIALLPGLNHIEVFTRGAGGNSSDAIDVTYTP